LGAAAAAAVQAFAEEPSAEAHHCPCWQATHGCLLLLQVCQLLLLQQQQQR
jgi:hypothetical protein